MEEKKILYISCALKESFSGGGLCTKRNLEAIQTIFGEEHVDTYIITPSYQRRSFKEKILRGIEVLCGYMGGLTFQDKKQILREVQTGDYDYVFIDSSQLGYLAKAIRKISPNINICTFFQNIEYDFIKSVTIGSGDYKHFFWIPITKYNETLACKYSNKLIVLNKADSHRIFELYGKEANAIIPITLKNDYFPQKQKQGVSNPPHAVFVGSYFPGNTEGIKWFCKEILPFVSLKMTVIGSGMENLKNDIQYSDKLTIIGRVPSLTEYYEEADFAILPIISGGGMKVKTAEALKFGKFLIGTKEAFEGYDINKNVGIECNSSLDFITAINSFKVSEKFNKPSRDLFLCKFTHEASLSLFKEIFIW